MYLKGLGTAIDYNVALNWFKKSLANVNEEAQPFIDQIDAILSKLQPSQMISNRPKSLDLEDAKDIRIQEQEEKIAMLMAQLELLQRLKSVAQESGPKITNTDISKASNSVKQSSVGDHNNIGKKDEKLFTKRRQSNDPENEILQD